MTKTSAGIMMYKFDSGILKVFLVHPGGPFWTGKDKNAWGIPKGEVEEGEEIMNAAIREMKEETGIDASSKKLMELGSIRQRNGKIVHAWAFEGDWTGLLMCSSYMKMEWPLHSGKTVSFPEVDKAGFFDLEKAKHKMFEAQYELVERLKSKLQA